SRLLPGRNGVENARDRHVEASLGDQSVGPPCRCDPADRRILVLAEETRAPPGSSDDPACEAGPVRSGADPLTRQIPPRRSTSRPTGVPPLMNQGLTRPTRFHET